MQKDSCILKPAGGHEASAGGLADTPSFVIHPALSSCVSLKKSSTSHSTYKALLVKLMERFHHKHAPVIIHLIKMKH